MTSLDLSEASIVEGGGPYGTIDSNPRPYDGEVVEQLFYTQNNILGKWMFVNCDVLRSIILPNNVTTIEEYCFWDAEGLDSITIGKAVTHIKAYACLDGNVIYCNATTPPTLDDNVLTPSWDKILYVPAGCKESYENSDWKNYFTIIIEMKE